MIMDGLALRFGSQVGPVEQLQRVGGLPVGSLHIT
jgi:hypothetical protein